MAGDDIGEVGSKGCNVNGLVNPDKEFSVHENPLKSCMQESDMIIFMFDDHFCCFGRLNCRGSRVVCGSSLSGHWAHSLGMVGCGVG